MTATYYWQICKERAKVDYRLLSQCMKMYSTKLSLSLSLSLDYDRTISMLICSTTANYRYSNTKILMHTFFQYYVHILHSRFHRGHHHCHTRKVTWNIWTKLVPTGNTETGCNQWRHCWAKIVLFTYVWHYSWNAFVLLEIGNFTVQINAYQEGTKVNTEVNERVLKNLGTNWNIRHHWFQLVPISSTLAKLSKW